MNNIAVAYIDSSDADKAKKIAQRWQLTYIGDIASMPRHPELDFVLRVNHQYLELAKLDEPKLGAIKVDFLHLENITYFKVRSSSNLKMKVIFHSYNEYSVITLFYCALQSY